MTNVLPSGITEKPNDAGSVEVSTVVVVAGSTPRVTLAQDWALPAVPRMRSG